MKTKKLSKLGEKRKIKILIFTVIFLLFSSLPGNAQNGSCSKVGVEANWVIYNDGTIIIDHDKVEATGTKWVRINFRLGDFTSLNDEWITIHNEIINGFVERGIQVYGLIGKEVVDVVIDGTRYDEDPGDIFRKWVSPTGNDVQLQWINAYATNFETIVNEFKDRVKVFESYNEPNGYHGGDKAKVDPEWFATMLQRIDEKRTDNNNNNNSWDDVILVSGPIETHDTNTGASYIQDTFDFGWATFDWEYFPVDGFGLHIYVAPGSTDSAVITDKMNTNLDAFWDAISMGLPLNKKIYVSEFGWVSSGTVGENGQADNLNTAFDVLKADDRVAIAIWFSLANIITDGLEEWGLYDDINPLPEDSREKPSFYAFRNQTCSPFTSLDLCFVIDSSGSMWDDIANVQNCMNQILAEVAVVDDYRISIVDFKHYYLSPYASRVALDFTNNTQSILNAINSLGASGGASPGEAVYAGLMCAFTSCSFGAGSGMSPWRDDALKIAILLGDEPPYTGSQEFTFEQVVAAADAGGALTTKATSATDGIHIYSILIGSNSTAKYYFTQLAEETGGLFFNALTANDVVDAILEAIGSIPGPGPTNSAPDVSGATASVSNIWPPNNKMIDIQILDVVDPDGDPVTITITAITQDEPVNQTGSKKKEPDAEGIGTDTAWVRAERDGNGNGRVYEITFEASDDKGATAEGSVKVCVPHDQGEDTVCIDDGQNYDSTSF